jgi:uncharacterized membrane protein
MAENEDADDLAIMFRSAGKPVRMSSATKWRRAITLGDLTRDTPVEVVVGGRALGVRPAGEVAALKPLFDEISPLPHGAAVAAAEPAPEPPDETPEVAEAVAVAEPIEATAPTFAETEPPRTPTPPPPVPPTPTATKAGGKNNPFLGCVGVLAIIVIIAVTAVKSCSHHRPDDVSAEAVQTVYVTRHVNLRPAPSAENPASGALERGAALTGSWSDATKTWFKITAGDHQGSYVWGMDLADRQRPDIATSVGGPQITVGAVTERREPDATSPAERDVAAGESLTVVGKLASGWWEVTNKGKTASTIAGVGYVPAETFEAPSSAVPPGDIIPPADLAPTGLSINGCNQSARAIDVAYVFLPQAGGSQWKYKGWTRLNPTECKLLFVTDTADFYMRAETADQSSPLEWGGAVKRCVTYPGPYEYDLELSGTCPSGSKTAGFFRRNPANTTGTYTETFR